MVVYHALYDVNDVFGFHVWIFDYLSVLEPYFAGAFILLAGVSCRFSHSNAKRGLRVFGIAMVVTLVTVLFSVLVSPGQEIYFGILHFMGIAILLYALIRRPVDKIPPYVALPLYIVLFAVTYNMPWNYQVGLPGLFTLQLPVSLAYVSQTLVSNLDAFFRINLPAWVSGVVGLYPLGLPGADFTSADYFPLIPWFFLFLAGTVIGVPIKDHKLPDKFYTARVPFFAAAGRNTLMIYVIHQPVIYVILLLLFNIFPH
jgi:uncharacterized membrane protein